MLPSLFISHGAPTVMIETDSPAHHFLKKLGTDIARPQAIVIISAHWETPAIKVSGALSPRTIHDFSGFPQELYQMHYPAPGDPDLAGEIAQIFGAEIDPIRGFDHGVWAPLMLMFPDADIPVVQVSLPHSTEPRAFYEMGQKLKTLRTRDILVIGSGSATHNLRALRWGQGHPDEWARSFEDWLVDHVEASDHKALLGGESDAPHFLKNHPSPEHWTPFYVALGAGERGRTLHRGFEHKNLSMAAFAFD